MLMIIFFFVKRDYVTKKKPAEPSRRLYKI